MRLHLTIMSVVAALRLPDTERVPDGTRPTQIPDDAR